MAVVADRNPWMKSPGAEGKDPSLLASYVPRGSKKMVNRGNAITHQEEGQNVLFMDGHVGFEKQPFCGAFNDNIYTYWDGGDIRRGGYPIPGATEPQDRLDSYLVNDYEGPTFP
jgi:prepilin-type processing-associated H-X9-DG protein